MTARTLYAYLSGDFGAGFPADPLAAAQTVAGLPLTLDRSASPVSLALRDGVLVGPVRVGARLFAAGDLVQETWTLVDLAKGVRLVGYDLRSDQPSDPGISVIGSALPLKPGQSYQLSLAPTDGAGSAEFFGGFAAGTRLLTEAGKRAIEDVAVGDRIWTDGAGFQPVIWHGLQVLRARGHAAPVLLRRGFLGLSDDLRIAGSQAIRIETPDGPVLVPAASFVAAGHAIHEFGASITWHQLLLPDHAVIFAHGLPCESFWPHEAASLRSLTAWPKDYRPSQSPKHPRLTEAEAVRLLE